MRGRKNAGRSTAFGREAENRACERRLGQSLVKEAEEQGASLYSAPDALFKLASEVETPQNVIFSCEQPQWTAAALDGAGQVLLLDGLQDPGNLGTILRTPKRSRSAPLCCARAAPIRFHPRSCARRWARCSVCRA